MDPVQAATWWVGFWAGVVTTLVTGVVALALIALGTKIGRELG